MPVTVVSNCQAHIPQETAALLRKFTDGPLNAQLECQLGGEDGVPFWSSWMRYMPYIRDVYMMLGPLQGKYTHPGSKGWKRKGLHLASPPITHQGTSCLSSPHSELCGIQGSDSQGYTLAKGHSKSSTELQATTARRVLWTPFIQGHWGN